MPKGVHLDLDVIHALLWERCDRLHRLRINQHDLAAELNVTKFTMSRVMTRLIDQKRLRHISNTRQNSGMFVVEEPDEWRELFGDVW